MHKDNIPETALVPPRSFLNKRGPSSSARVEPPLRLYLLGAGGRRAGRGRRSKGRQPRGSRSSLPNGAGWHVNGTASAGAC
jgi:hypothetical protein